MRATELAVLLFILVSSVAVVNATVGQAVGIGLSNPAQDDVNHVGSNVTKDVQSGATDSGELSPLGAFGMLIDVVSLLPNVDDYLIALVGGEYGFVVQWVVAPISLFIALVIVTVVARTRL